MTSVTVIYGPGSVSTDSFDIWPNGFDVIHTGPLSLFQGDDLQWRFQIDAMSGVVIDTSGSDNFIALYVDARTASTPITMDLSLLGAGLHDLYAGYDTSGFETFSFFLLSGNGRDNLRVNSAFSPTVYMDGGGGRDTLSGGSNGDYLLGGDGGDVISGQSGGDYIDGGLGADFIEGGDGDDRIYNHEYVLDESSWNPTPPEAGTIDTALGGAGNDYIEDVNIVWGGDGNDTAGWSDVVHGDAGDDVVSGRIAYGDDGDDIVTSASQGFGGLGNDIMHYWGGRADGGEGDDLIEMQALEFPSADVFPGTALGGNGNDTLKGGNDDIRNLASAFAEYDGPGTYLSGGNGDDVLEGFFLNDTLIGGAGADTITGGAGDDVYYLDRFDTYFEEADGGFDTIRMSTGGFVIPEHFEGLVMTGWAGSATGNTAANRIDGNARNNMIAGLAGNDTLVGGAGADTLAGGTGADAFVFDDGDFGGTTLATADVIADFTARDADKIRLNLVDANSDTAVDDRFTFIGTAAFSGTSGQLRYEVASNGTDAIVMGDTNGDAAADFWIILNSITRLTAGFFVL